MKKVLIAGILALVVIGCVLAAGCTTTTSNLNQASGTMTEEGLNGAVVTTTEAAVTTAETPKIDVTFHWQDHYTVNGKGGYEKHLPASETVQIDQGTDVWVTKTYNDSPLWYYIHYIVNGEEKLKIIQSRDVISISTADNRAAETGEKLTINEPMDVYINR